MFRLSRSQTRFVRSLVLLSGLCLALYIVRGLATHSWQYLFVPENLGLAWLAIGLSWLLVQRLKTSAWSSWQNTALSILWLAFLPNTWYVLTDFVHVGDSAQTSQLYDIVMMGTLVFIGFTLGFSSLYLVHKEFLRRRSAAWSHSVVAIILLLCSFAIYLGRDLRWSTWDVLSNPSGIILNVTDRVVDPLGHPTALNVTGLFFVLLSVMYMAIWLVFEPPKKHSRVS
jgi:uncharacterized membrane protein